MTLAVADFVMAAPVSTRTLLLFSSSQFAALTLVRVVGFETLRILRRRGRNYRNVLVIGSGPRARRVQEEIRAHQEWGLRIVGYVDEEGIPVDPGVPRDAMHKLSDVPDLLRDEAIDEVIAASHRLRACSPSMPSSPEAGSAGRTPSAG
jgi:FlaA1/EpsC-like NDP-sugar epimerase